MKSLIIALLITGPFANASLPEKLFGPGADTTLNQLACDYVNNSDFAPYGCYDTCAELTEDNTSSGLAFNPKTKGLANACAVVMFGAEY